MRLTIQDQLTKLIKRNEELLASNKTLKYTNKKLRAEVNNLIDIIDVNPLMTYSKEVFEHEYNKLTQEH